LFGLMIRIEVGIAGLLDWVLKVSCIVCLCVIKCNVCMRLRMLYLRTHDVIAVEGPRIVRLAAVVDRGFKKGSCLDVNVFGTVTKSDF
jgi:hypothetical protein